MTIDPATKDAWVEAAQKILREKAIPDEPYKAPKRHSIPVVDTSTIPEAMRHLIAIGFTQAIVEDMEINLEEFDKTPHSAKAWRNYCLGYIEQMQGVLDRRISEYYKQAMKRSDEP